MECIEIHLLCKHSKKVRSSQASISISSCNELSKTVFLVSIVNEVTFPEMLVIKTFILQICNGTLDCFWLSKYG